MTESYRAALVCESEQLQNDARSLAWLNCETNACPTNYESLRTWRSIHFPQTIAEPVQPPASAGINNALSPSMSGRFRSRVKAVPLMFNSQPGVSSPFSIQRSARPGICSCICASTSRRQSASSMTCAKPARLRATPKNSTETEGKVRPLLS